MKRLLAAAVSFALSAAAGAATAHLIELRDHLRILAIDAPVLKGRVLAFHRYPDGAFVSVLASDVLGIAATTVAPQKASSSERARFLRGETVLLGPTGEGQTSSQTLPLSPAASSDAEVGAGELGDFFYGDPGCCSGPRPPAPRPPAPALVGPNGYPGSPVRPIGANGYPILAPSPIPR